MATKRKRSSRGAPVSEHDIAILGLGMGINSMTDKHLTKLWRTHGKAVMRIWQQRYGTTPFVYDIGREENWIAEDGTVINSDD